MHFLFIRGLVHCLTNHEKMTHHLPKKRWVSSDMKCVKISKCLWLRKKVLEWWANLEVKICLQVSSPLFLGFICRSCSMLYFTDEETLFPCWFHTWCSHHQHGAGHLTLETPPFPPESSLLRNLGRTSIIAGPVAPMIPPKMQSNDSCFLLLLRRPSRMVCIAAVYIIGGGRENWARLFECICLVLAQGIL